MPEGRKNKRSLKLSLDRIMLRVCDICDYFLLLWYDFKTKLAFSRSILDKEESQGIKIFPLYFTCRRDFKYLFISLKSLERLKLNCIKKVYIYADREDPLSLNQSDELKKEFPWQIFIRKTKYKYTWGGVTLIVNELSALKDIITEISQNDYVLKLDSDVLFISDNIFKEVLKGENEAVGQWVHPGFMEGGSSFLKYSLISKLINATLYNAIMKTYREEPGCELWGCRLSMCPEDRVLFKLMSQHHDKILLANFRVPTTKHPFLIDVNHIRISKKDLDGYSFMHFSKWCNLRKKDMEMVWDWLQDASEALNIFPFFDKEQEWFKQK